MNEYVKTVLTSGALAALVGFATAWYTTHKELQVRQAESGYEALVESDALRWHAQDLLEEAREKQDEKLAAEADTLRRKADALMNTARVKIATFGDEAIVKAMSHYFTAYKGASRLCNNQAKARDDARIYSAIRKNLGTKGEVSDEEMAILVFLCTVK